MARKQPQPVRITNGPWTGCFQSWDVAPNPTKELYTAFNCVFRNTQAGLAAQIRPGNARLGQVGVATDSILCTEAGVDILLEDGVTTLSTDGHRDAQCIYQHTRLDGTSDPFVFVGGRMYRWNADPVSPVFTDITPVTVLISPTSRIFCTTFADRLIVSDGVNRPWTYNPATAVATSIQYDSSSSAWNAYGPPVVYGAKLFFILNTIVGVSTRTTIAWSEEASPTTGYFQTNYDNTWTLTQTNADSLYCLAATNAALYYFRQDSIGAIYGAVSSTFRTSATQDSVSLTVGTTSPASVVRGGDYLWWMDRIGRPFRMRPGGQPEALWQQMQDGVDSGVASSTLSTSSLERYGCAGWHQELGVVGFSLWSSTANLPGSTLYIFDQDSGTFGGAWGMNGVNGSYFGALGLLRDANARQRFIVLGSDLADNGGVVYAHRLIGSGGATYYQDDTTQLYASIQSRMLGDDAASEYIFDRVDVELAGDDSAGATQSVTLATGSQRTQPSSQSTATSAVLEGTERVAFGLMQRARSLRCTATIQTTTATRVIQGFNRLVVTAFPDANDPGIP